MAGRGTTGKAVGAAHATGVSGAERDAAASGANRLEAWNRGDFALVPNIDDPEVETRVAQGLGVAVGLDEVYYGPEGHCRAMEAWNEAWSTWDAEIDEIIESGHDQVIVVSRVHAEGAASGIRLDEWGVVRYTFREGRILRVDGAFDPDRAHALELLEAMAG